MNELEAIARALCAGDGHDPDCPAWTLYKPYVQATLDAVINRATVAMASDLPNPAPDWRFRPVLISSNPRS